MTQSATHAHRWRKQIVKRRGEDAQLLVDQLLADLPAEDAEASGPVADGRSLARFAARICTKHRGETVVSAVFESLDDQSQLLDSLKFIQGEADQRRFRRQAACAETADLLPELNTFLGFLARSARYPAVPLRIADIEGLDRSYANGESILAYTNSQEIFLPPRVATSPHAKLNELFVLYLVAHEFAHCAGGSFDFDGQSRQAIRVAARFSKWEPTVQHRAAFDTQLSEVVAQLKSEGSEIDRMQVEAVERFGMQSLLNRLSHPNLARHILNAIEDGRIERTLIRPLWPGLAAVHVLHDRLGIAICEPSDRFSAPFNRLINAIGAHAAERHRKIELPADLRSVFKRVKVQLNAQSRLLGESIYDSLVTLVNIWELIEPVLKEMSAEADACEASAAQPILLIEQELRFADAAETKPDDWIELPSSDYERPPTDEGVMVDEIRFQATPRATALSGQSQTPVPPQIDKASVQVIESEILASEDQRPLADELRLPFPTLNSAQRWKRLSQGRRWSPDGARIANHRLASYYAASLAGSGDTIPVAYHPQHRVQTIAVTLLFDLSISMERPRKRLMGQTSIDSAVQIGRWISDNLASQNVAVEVYGGVDGGRRPVKLFAYSGASDACLATIKPMGFGGFRLGPMLRALPFFRQTRRGSKPSDRNATIVFTDAAGMYMQRNDLDGRMEGLHRNSCATCVKRANCIFEGGSYDSHRRRSDYPEFLPPSHAWQDVGHAISQQPTEFHHVYVLGEKIPATSLNAGIGDQWSDASTPDGILAGILRLAQFAKP